MSKRKEHVLRLFADGKTVKEISDLYGVSANTIYLIAGKARNLKEVKCEECGKVFKRSIARQKYCSPTCCKYASKKRYSPEKKREHVARSYYRKLSLKTLNERLKDFRETRYKDPVTTKRVLKEVIRDKKLGNYPDIPSTLDVKDILEHCKQCGKQFTKRAVNHTFCENLCRARHWNTPKKKKSEENT